MKGLLIVNVVYSFFVRNFYGALMPGNQILDHFNDIEFFSRMSLH